SSMLGKDYIVIGANDGEAAIDIAHRQEPALILMDIMMPKVDGYNACYVIKNDPTTKKIPVVMLTAVGYELNRKLANEVGADGYITKPFTLQELLEAINRFLTDPE
ncbi:unnamed protein product, partial [marine sediment metagenome]